MTAPKTIILTGSFLPEKFKDSDADFNLGFAIGAVMSYRTLQGYTSIVELKSVRISFFIWSVKCAHVTKDLLNKIRRNQHSTKLIDA